MTPLFRDLPLGIRLFLMFVMLFFNLVIVSYVALLFVPVLFGIDKPESVLSVIPESTNQINAFLFIQGFTSLGGFLLTALLFAQLEAGAVGPRLKANVFPPGKLLLLAAFSIIVSQFFIEFLVELNNKIPVPSSLSFLTDLQKTAENVTNSILNFKNAGQFFIVTIVLAVIPALAEEMFFRGLLLGSLLRGKVHPAVAIPVTGLIFSISHAEFQNTLAIWALGSFLGYLYYVSGSLWLPVTAHFVNNFLQVFFKYLYNTGHISADIVEASMPLYVTIISILIFGACIFVFNKWKTPADFDDGEPHIDFDNQTIGE